MFFKAPFQFDPTGGDEASLSILHDRSSNGQEWNNGEVFLPILLKRNEQRCSLRREADEILVSNFEGLA